LKKRVSRSRKRDLEQPDEFITLSSRLLEKLIQYKMQAALASAGVLVLVMAIMAFQYFSERSEQRAFSKLDQASKAYSLAKGAESPQQAYEQVKSQFEDIIDDYSGNEGGKAAGLTFANISYAAGAYDSAIALYKKALENFQAQPVIKNLILNSLGYCYEAKKDYTTAAGYFEKTLENPFFNDEALFNLGGVYAAMGDDAKSVAAFKKVAENHAESMFADVVKEKIGS
jgi:tetratricopeptide (TPR) repeat protein